MVFDILAWGVTFVVGYIIGKTEERSRLFNKLMFPEIKSRYEKYKEGKDSKETEKIID